MQTNIFRPECLGLVAPRLRSWSLRVEQDKHSDIDLSTLTQLEARLEAVLPEFTAGLENLEELRLPSFFGSFALFAASQTPSLRLFCPVRHLMPTPGKRSIAAFVPRLPSLKRLVTWGRPPTEIVHRGDTDPDGLEHIFFCGENLFKSDSSHDHSVALNSFWDFPLVIDSSLSACTRPCTLLHMFVGLTRCTAKNLHSFLDGSGSPFDVNQRLDGGPIAIHVAIKRKHKDAVQILLDKGSDVTLRDTVSSHSRSAPSCHNAITLAAHSSTLPVLMSVMEGLIRQRLIDSEPSGYGTPTVLRDGRGATILALAAARTDVDGAEVLKWLLEPAQMQTFHLDVNDDSSDLLLTPLHFCRSVESAKALVAAGADMAARSAEGDTPFVHIIVSHAYKLSTEILGVASLLRQLGAPMPHPGSLELSRALGAACTAPATTALELLLQIADPIRDLSRADLKDGPLLLQCALSGKMDHLTLLLAAGANATVDILYNGQVVSYIEALLIQQVYGSQASLMRMILAFASHGCRAEVRYSTSRLPSLSAFAADFVSKSPPSVLVDELTNFQRLVNLIIQTEGPAGTFALAIAIIGKNSTCPGSALLSELVFNTSPGACGAASLLAESIMRGDLESFRWLLVNKSMEENFCPTAMSPYLAVLHADPCLTDEQRVYVARTLADSGCVFDGGLLIPELQVEQMKQFPHTAELFLHLNSLVVTAPHSSLLLIGEVEEISRDEETSLMASTDEMSDSVGPPTAANNSAADKPAGRRRSARLEAKAIPKPTVQILDETAEPPAKRPKRS